MQEHIKLSLIDFLVQNSIIHLQHHGGLKHHSTTTALACLTHQLKQFMDDNMTTTTLQTDMSTAFNTVEHTILLQKLEYYRIRGGELNFFKSFLTNRRQYVEIDGIKSDKLESLNCSTIQGSKLSCILYIIYVNEVTALNKIMDTCYYQIMTLKERLLYRVIK